MTGRRAWARGALAWLVAASVAVAVLAGLAPAPAGAGTAPGLEPAASAGDGGMEAIVGPGVCRGAGRLDPASVEVRTLAVDADGRTFVDTGPPERGQVARVDEFVRATLLPARTTESRPAPLASDRRGGLYAAMRGHITHFGGPGGASRIAGDLVDGPARTGAGDGGPAGEARFAGIERMASDAAGNLYVADRLEAGGSAVVVRFVNRGEEPVVFSAGTPAEVTVEPGHIATIAGGGQTDATTIADAGDGGPALGATLHGDSPALTVAGDRLYVASYATVGNTTVSGVRLVNLGADLLVAHGIEVAPGAVETVAGGNPAGFRGEGELAVEARFGRLTGLAVDEAGSLYVADGEHHRIRRVDAAGAVSTFAGTGPVAGPGGFNGNGRLATDARLDRPFDVAVAPDDGRVFFTDRGNGQLRVVDGDGIVHAAPGNGLAQAWSCEDQDGRPLSARDSERLLLPAAPLDVAVEGPDTYFLVASSSATNPLPLLYRRNRAGRVAPVAGGIGQPGCPDARGCDGGTVSFDDAPLGRPAALTTDGRDAVYILDVADGGRLWLLNIGTEPLAAHGTTVGPRQARAVASDIVADGARHGALAADGRGTVYVADRQRVHRLDPDGAVTGVGVAYDPDELDLSPPGRCCAIPAGVAVDAGGNLYVSDPYRSGARVWLFNMQHEPIVAHGQEVPPGQAVPVAGSEARGIYGDAGDGGPALEADLRAPTALALNADGELFFVDLDEHTVRRVDTDGTITTVAGTGGEGFNGDWLHARLSTLQYPSALAADACGNLLVADTFSQRLRRANLAGPCVEQAIDHDVEEPGAGRNGIVVFALAGAGVAVGGGLLGLTLARRPGHA